MRFSWCNFISRRQLTVKADNCELTVEGAWPEAEHEGPQSVNLRALAPIILRNCGAPLDSLAGPIHQQSPCVSVPLQGVSLVSLGHHVSHAAFVRIDPPQPHASGWDDAIMRRVEDKCIRPRYYQRISLLSPHFHLRLPINLLTAHRSLCYISDHAECSSQ